MLIQKNHFEYFKIFVSLLFYIQLMCSAAFFFQGYNGVAGSPGPQGHEGERVSNIRIYYECEGRMEKSFPRIAVWHHEACRVMTNGDPEGQILLSYPHTNNGFFFLFTTVFFLFKNKLQEVPQYTKIQFHMMTSLSHNNDVT